MLAGVLQVLNASGCAIVLQCQLGCAPTIQYERPYFHVFNVYGRGSAVQC